MLGSKNIVEGLLRHPEMIARVVPADGLFTWLSRTFTPPAGWLAWTLRAEQDPLLVGPGESCPAEGVIEALFVRSAAVECVIEDTALRSADGHSFSGRLRLQVRVVAEPAELAAFRKTVLGAHATLTRTDLQRYLQWPGRTFLAAFAASREAQALLQPLEPAELRRAVDQRLGAACLAGGLCLEDPVRVEFESEAFLDHRRREQELARRRSEMVARAQIQQALAAAQSQRLAHLIAMLEQMREASRQHGERTMMELLAAFSPAERGQMYSALWHLSPSPRRTRWISAVSGAELLLFDPGDLKQPGRRHRLPNVLGPLRSVNTDARSPAGGTVLVGAATGVFVVEVETGRVLRTLRAGPSAKAVRGGVNSAAAGANWIIGSHSELGVLGWPAEGDDEAEARPMLAEPTRGARTVRCALAAGETAWVAIDDRVFRFRPDASGAADVVAYSGSRAEITALAVTADALYAGNADGQVLCWPIQEPAAASVVRGGGGAVESVDVITASGVDWLITADQEDALIACVLGDTYSCGYRAGGARIRRAVVYEDLFAAMNDNRDRLIAWRPDRASEPIGTVIIPYLTGERIQDVCLIPA